MDSGFQLGDLSREWEILVSRFGPRKSATLQEIGDVLVISRERVRQLEAAALRDLSRELGTLIGAIEKACVRPEPSTFTDSEFSQQITDLLQELQQNRPDPVNSTQFISLIRGLVSSKKLSTIAIERWPNLTFAASMIDPGLKKHPKVAILIAENQKRWTYNELGVHVLEQANTPLHWKEIVDRAENSNLRKDVYPTTMFNAIQAADDIFARVGQGTYGLVSWGLEDVPFFKDTILSILKSSGNPMTRGSILHSVNQVRQIKPSSLNMYLDLDPMFYRAKSGEYGIREWLPEENLQTLRTPKAYVESRESRKRLKRNSNDLG